MNPWTGHRPWDGDMRAGPHLESSVVNDGALSCLKASALGRTELWWMKSL